MEHVFLTVPEVAELLRTTPKGVFCAISRGQVPGVVRVGRRVLVSKDVLLRVLTKDSTVAGK